jgi:hypothetical protein
MSSAAEWIILVPFGVIFRAPCSLRRYVTPESSLPLHNFIRNIIIHGLCDLNNTLIGTSSGSAVIIDSSPKYLQLNQPRLQPLLGREV